MIAIYVRVSTEEQATKGYSIEQQIDLCKQKAGTSEVLEYVDEGYTGEIINRPKLSKMREDIKKGLITKVVCYDPDRLSRNLLIQLLLDEEFKKHNVDLAFVNGEYSNNAEGKMFFSMRGAISEFEKAKIKERTSGGKLRKAKKGLVVKNGHIYGYEYDKTKSMYVINEKEAKVIRMIFDYYTDPNSPFKGINGIATHLTEIGIPTKRGAKVWHRQVVRQILMNQAYVGEYIQNRWDTVGDYVRKQAGEKIEHGRMRPEEDWIITHIPPIIVEEQFEYAQSLIDQGRRRYTNNGIRTYLLSGLVRCGKCGATMTGKKRKSHGKDFFIYTCRKNYSGASNRGCGKQISTNKLNNIVWDNVVELIKNPDRIEEFKDTEEKTYIKEELEHLQAEIEKTKKGRKRLFALVSLSEDDDMDLEEIKEQIRELQLKEKDLQSKYNQLSQENNTKKQDNSKKALENAIALYVSKSEKLFTIEEKQNLIRTLVKEVIVIDSVTIHIQTF